MPTVGLSMIVKNEAETLRHCLQSVSGVVSQIVIADTGSTDGTADIAREFGATVISVPWENHFANARNAALKLMETDWVLVLDADEELDSEAKAQLPDLLRPWNVGGYLVPIRNYIPTVTGRGWDRVAEPNRSHASPGPAGSGIFRSRKLPPVSPRSRNLFRRTRARTGGTANPGSGAAIAHGSDLHSSFRPVGAGRGKKPEGGSVSRSFTSEGSGLAQRRNGLDPARPAGIRMLTRARGTVALFRTRPRPGAKSSNGFPLQRHGLSRLWQARTSSHRLGRGAGPTSAVALSANIFAETRSTIWAVCWMPARLTAKPSGSPETIPC